MSKHEITLLVADSNRTNLDTIKNTLTSFDDTPYKISSAKSCKEVTSMIAGGDVAILLLDPNMNVFATTASNATTSSYACYFDKVLKEIFQN